MSFHIKINGTVQHDGLSKDTFSFKNDAKHGCMLAQHVFYLIVAATYAFPRYENWDFFLLGIAVIFCSVSLISD